MAAKYVSINDLLLLYAFRAMTQHLSTVVLLFFLHPTACNSCLTQASMYDQTRRSHAPWYDTNLIWKIATRGKPPTMDPSGTNSKRSFSRLLDFLLWDLGIQLGQQNDHEIQFTPNYVAKPRAHLNNNDRGYKIHVLQNPVYMYITLKIISWIPNYDYVWGAEPISVSRFKVVQNPIIKKNICFRDTLVTDKIRTTCWRRQLLENKPKPAANHRPWFSRGKTRVESSPARWGALC